MTDAVVTLTTKIDLLGRVVEYTDVYGKVTTTTYDQVGNVTTRATTDQLPMSFTVDAAGRVLTVKRNSLVLATPEYDAAGRMFKVTYPSGAGNAGNNTVGLFGIDSLGRAASTQWSVAGGAVLTTDAVTRSVGGRVVDQTVDGVDPYAAGPNFVYDPAGWLTDERTVGHTYTYGYAATGGCGLNATAGKNTNRTAVVDNGVATTSCYDFADRLTATSPVDAAGPVAYDGHGNTTNILWDVHTAVGLAGPRWVPNRSSRGPTSVRRSTYRSAVPGRRNERR